MFLLPRGHAFQPLPIRGGGCDICGNLPLLSLARFLFRCRSCWRSLNSFRGPHAQDARKEDVPRGLEFSICPRSSCRPRRRLSAARAVSRPPPPLTPSWCLISRTFHVDVGRPSYPEYPPRVILEASMTLSGFSPARGRGRRLSRRDRSRTPRSPPCVCPFFPDSDRTSISPR